MKTAKEPAYFEWKSAEELHEEFNNWLLELHFMENEMGFMRRLTEKYFLSLSDPEHFRLSQSHLIKMEGLEAELSKCLGEVKAHGNRITVLLDGKDQLKEEWDYKRAHLEMQHKVQKVMSEFSGLKKNFFEEVLQIIKAGKPHLLLHA